MRIGIIGSGGLGSSVARALGSKGVSATISNSRGPESLAALVEEAGPSITAGTVQEAASADIVLVAVRWVDASAVLSGLPPWNGRILIDGTNPVEFIDPDSADAKDPNNPVGQYGKGRQSRRQTLQRGHKSVRARRADCQGVQPSRRSGPVRARSVRRAARAVLFGR